MSELIFDIRASKPSAPDIGEVSVYFTDKPKFIGSDNIERSFEAVFGQDYIGDSISGEDTNTLDTFKTYLGVAYPAGLAVAGRKYEIDFNCLTRYSTTGRNHIVRVALDGSTLEEEIGREHKDTGADIREPVSYKYIIDGSQLNNAGGFIDFDYRTQRAGDTARVYSCTLTFKRVI